MKKISLFCMLGLLLGVSCSKEKVKPPAMTDDTVAVFGDDAFGAFCLRTYDRNGDGVLTVGEIKNVVSLDFDDKDIRSLDGIEYFTGLQSLYTNLPGVIWCGSMSAGMRNSGLCVVRGTNLKNSLWMASGT